MTAPLYEAADWVDPVVVDRKKFADALIDKASRNQAYDKLVSSSRSLKQRLVDLMHAFKLDALAGAVNEQARRLFDLGRGQLAWLLRKLGPIGWRAPLALLLTSSRIRGNVIEGFATWERVIKVPVVFLGRVISFVPFVGKPIVNALGKAYTWLSSKVSQSVSSADEFLTGHEGHPVVSLIKVVAGSMVLSRLVTAFVPKKYQTAAKVVVFAATILRDVDFDAMNAAVRRNFNAVVDDPTVQEVKVDLRKAGVKIADRVVDGAGKVVDEAKPAPAAPKPAPTFDSKRKVETVQVLVKDTNTFVDVILDTDHWGHQQVLWDGIYYDWSDLGTAETDPIRRRLMDEELTKQPAGAMASAIATETVTVTLPKEVSERIEAEAAAETPATTEDRVEPAKVEWIEAETAAEAAPPDQVEPVKLARDLRGDDGPRNPGKLRPVAKPRKPR